MADFVSDRLRHLAPARIEPVDTDVRALLDELAGLARGAEGLAPRPLPAVLSRAYGDQVSVLTHDLLEACGATGTGAADEPLGEAHSVLVALRRLLP